MHKIYILLSFLLSFQLLCGQTTLTQNIIGQITDQNTQAPLVGAEIQVDGTELGAVSDEEGYFKIEKVPVGRQNIRVNYIGYKEAAIANLWVTSAKEVVVNVSLIEGYVSAKEVVITANSGEHAKSKPINEMATVSARTLSVEETGRFAGTLSDPSRAAANYAGVVGANDQLNSIIVRGNAPTGVLWRLEGIDIGNPSHFAQIVNYGGFFSILNSNVLGNSDFMTGAFPSEYGNKTAAVFDVKMRNGNYEKREFTAQLGINGIELGAEGPFSKENHSSYIANYRLFNFSPIKKLGIDLKIGGLPNYQDINFKLNFPTKKYGRFSFFGIGGISEISILDSEKDSTDWNYQTGGRDVYYTSNRGMLGFTHNYMANEKTYSKLAIGLNGNLVNADLEALKPNGTKQFAERNRTTETNLQVRYEVGHKISVRHFVKVGAAYSHTKYLFTYVDSILHFRSKVETSPNFGQTYIHWQWKASRKLTLNTGLYGQYLDISKSYSIEPRSSIQYEFTPRHKLALGYGLHSQAQNWLVYNSDYNKKLGFSKAHHLVLSYDYYAPQNWRIKAETYYQYLFKNPISPTYQFYSLLNLGESFDFNIPDTLISKGLGKNYGIEITAEKFFSQGYYFLTTLSLYDAKFKAFDGRWRNTAFNSVYAYNILGGYEWRLGKEKRNAISFDTKFTIVGGRPYIPIDLEASKLAKQQVLDIENAYKVRNKPFNRLDAKVSYRLNNPKTAHFIFIGCNNLLNYQNELSVYYDAKTETVQKNYMLGIFPYGGYKIQF